MLIFCSRGTVFFTHCEHCVNGLRVVKALSVHLFFLMPTSLKTRTMEARLGSLYQSNIDKNKLP